MKMQKIKINEIKTADYNPRKNLTEKDSEYVKIKNSLTEFGYVSPIIVNSDMTVISGHQRLKVLKDLGHTEIECIIVEFDKNKEKLLNVALNKISGEWDYQKLESLFNELANTDFDLSITGFDNEEIDELFNEYLVNEEVFDVDKEISKIEKPITRLGDIWILGKHRLMCGDSTNKKDVKKLMNGKKIKCLFTSPPYNMGANLYENYTDNLESKKYIDFNLDVIKTWVEYIRGYLFWNISYNRNTRWEFIEILYRIIKESGLRFMELIVWDKGHGMPIVAKDMLTRQYEDILMLGDDESISNDMELYYLGTTEKRGYFNKKKGKGITNYWRIGTENTQLNNHKACFPVDLPVKAIELTTQIGEIVVDCFRWIWFYINCCRENKENMLYDGTRS
ncbi:MAG: DNA modification methylase [Clostridia bacterium]|nr:DNA modification methylase [Clostridia bacterium]